MVPDQVLRPNQVWLGKMEFCDAPHCHDPIAEEGMPRIFLQLIPGCVQ